MAKRHLTRREFMRTAAITSGSLVVASCVPATPAPPAEAPAAEAPDAWSFSDKPAVNGTARPSTRSGKRKRDFRAAPEQFKDR